MDLEQALYSALTTPGTDLHDQIKSRLYPDSLPQSVTLPAVVYQRISTTFYHAFGHQPAAQRPRIQFDVYSTSKATVMAAAWALQARLRGLSGEIGPEGDQIEIATPLEQDMQTHYEQDTGYYRGRLDAMIFNVPGGGD